MPDFPDAALAHNPREAALQTVCALQQQATAAGMSLRAPPPEPDSCCGRGCNGCVWEGYYTAVACWQEDALARLNGVVADPMHHQTLRF